ncbi:hypothetical protein AB0D04_27050 [Streptomyces sp. NPDC048483]|uniref:hypothetical protein n=1 Tax=Streptomyces sp. NPDC048483 TaxID=3154927 RepID=UPI003424B190
MTGAAELSTSHGEVLSNEIGGTAAVKNLNGTTGLGTVMGDLRFTGVNGDFSVKQAHARVEAKTANGNLRVGEIVRGSVALETATGSVRVGVRDGTAAWLDVHCLIGTLRNGLRDSEGPGKSEESVKVRARTVYGDVDVHHA